MRTRKRSDEYDPLRYKKPEKRTVEEVRRVVGNDEIIRAARRVVGVGIQRKWILSGGMPR